MSNNIGILHTADIHVQNREINLYNEYKKILSNKINVLIETKAEVYLVAGDFFQFTEQTDSEQELIFTHIAEALNVESVKEVVIMGGNHDFPTDYKAFNSNKTHNALDTLYKFVRTLAPELYNKLTYLKKQQQYTSKADERLGWVAYSLEDGMSNGNNIDFTQIDESKLNISIFHDIVRDYVEESGLPVANDKLKHLPYVKDFKTVNILSGDIHKNFTKTSSFLELQNEGAFKQKFSYCGSSNQTNFGEGAYIIVRKTKTKKTVGDKKVIKLHTANLDVIDSELTTKDIVLPNVVTYITIDCNTRYSIPNHLDEILKHLDDPTLFGDEKTFIKLKLSSEYLKYEANIYDALKTFCLPYKNVIITIVHDKLVLEVDNNIIENVEGEHTTEIETDTVLEKLSNEKIKELFNSTIESVLGEEVYGVDNSSVIESIRSLFAEQLNLTDLTNTQTYNTVLKDINCTSFMRLGANQIDLGIEGLIRIDGTNGVGKTTLFNMLRYATKGVLYEGLNAKATKNKALIFNNNYRGVEDDTIVVELNATVNNTPIRVARKSVRKWKTNVTEEQKKSKNNKSFISTITNSVFLYIMKEGSDLKTFEGDEAERYLDIWFGDVVDNLMILNQNKLQNTLNLGSAELRSMILNYIGVDYLRILEDNLESVKLNYNLQKPKTKIEDVRKSLDDNKKTIADSVELLEGYDKELTVVNNDIALLKNNETSLTNKLIEFGNLPQNITNTESEITDLKTKIADFNPMEMPTPLTVAQPVLDKESIDEIDKKNLNIHNGVIGLQNNTTTLRNEITTLLESNTQIEIDNKKVDDECLVKVAEVNGKIADAYGEITSITNGLLTKLKENHSNCLGNVGGWETQVKTLTETNTNLQKDIDNGVCSECNRAFDKEAHEQHKIKNEGLIEVNNKTITECNENITKTNTLIGQLSTFITRYENLVGLCQSKNISELTIFQFNAGEVKSKELVELINKYLNDIIDVKVEYSEKLTPLVNPLTHPRILEINETITKNDTNIDTLNKVLEGNNTLSKKINDDYITASNEYNNLVKSYNDEVTKVNEHNSSISSLNASLQISEAKLLELQNNKPAYEKCVDDKALTLVAITEKETERDNVTKNKHEFELRMRDVEANIKALNLEHENYIKYIFDSKVFTTYQKIIQTNLPELVFNYYRNFINSKLNILLEDMSIKLYLDENCNLFMVDMTQGEIVYIPVQTISGMQNVMLGLSLMYTISLLNNTNSISHLFIDELSGALNNGKNSVGEVNTNYQEQFVLLLSKFNEKSVWIVDHAIDNLFNNYTYTVIGNKDDKKSYFIGKL